MIHRTVYGGIERFYGILLEHYGGNFPLWLSPVQVKIVTVNDSNKKFRADGTAIAAKDTFVLVNFGFPFNKG